MYVCIYTPRIYSYSQSRYPLVIVGGVRVLRMKNALLIFHLVFWLKAKLDYWYMPPCIYIHTYMPVSVCVCVRVFEEIIQISGTAGECVYMWAWHTRTRVTQKFIALPHRTPPPFQIQSASLSFSLLFHFRFATPLLPSLCSCHTSQVSFICNNFSFYTLYS